MKKTIKAFDLSDLSPIKFINKHLDFTEGEWFEEGEKVILNTPMHDADFRKNMTTGEIDPETVKLFKELNGQEVEIIKIDKTESGEAVGPAKYAKPTYVTIRFKDGQEWKEVPTLWLSKKEEKEVEAEAMNKTYSSLEGNKNAIGRISDLLDAGFEQEEIIDVVCNEYDCEPNEVEQFLRKVTAFSENINAVKLNKEMQAALKEARKLIETNKRK